MDYNNLQIQIDEHIATITLNRPSVLNALSANLTSELHQALDELGGNKNVWVIILTGSGRGFCSGADVSEWGKADRPVPTKPLVELGIHIRETPQPVIAAINGIAVGAGLTIAISSDMRIASSDARFSSIFVKRSIVLDTGASYLLPKLVGPGIASEMSLTCNVYDSELVATQLKKTGYSQTNDIESANIIFLNTSSCTTSLMSFSLPFEFLIRPWISCPSEYNKLAR